MSEAPRSKNEIASWLTTEVARRLKKDASTIDPTVCLVDYGLDSPDAVAITEALAVWLRRDFPFMLLFEYQTIDAISDYLAREET